MLIGSSEWSKPLIVVFPFEIAPKRRERWDIDLSPGTFTCPFSLPPEGRLSVTVGLLLWLKDLGSANFDLIG